MKFDTGTDYLHDEFTVRISKDELKSISTSDLRTSDLEFIEELNVLFKSNQIIEIDGRFQRFIDVGELN